MARIADIIYSNEAKDALRVIFINENDKKPLESIPDSFTGKKLEGFYLPEKKTYVMGLGKKEEFKLDYYRRAAARALKMASAYKMPAIFIDAPGLDAKAYVALAEGALLANYSFDKYKSDDSKFFRVQKIVLPQDARKAETQIDEADLVCANNHIVRDLVSDNSDVVMPQYFEELAKKIADENKLKFTAFHMDELQKMGMNCLLAVGKASTQSPRLLALEYGGDPSSQDKFLLVGKGICFDTGGLDLKPRDSMLEMRIDMAGAATVLGIIKSAAELKMKKNIVAIMAVTENLIGENAYRPKDIIRSYSGKTIENLDTDAEGRLVLADALNYGVKTYSPRLVVEFSTLTGSVVGTFGSHTAGMFANSQTGNFKQKMFDAGMETYERVWELPLFEEYLDETTGDRSDFRSLGKSRYNGAIFGGAFLSKFVEDKPFIHLDVAGTAHIEEPKDYMPRDGTGFGVRLAIEFLKRV